MAKANKPADPPSIKDTFSNKHIATNLKGAEVIKYFSKNTALWKALNHTKNLLILKL